MNKVILFLAAYASLLNACEDGDYQLITKNDLAYSTYQDEDKNVCSFVCEDPLISVLLDQKQRLCLDKCQDYPGLVNVNGRCLTKCPIGLKTTNTSVKCVPSVCKGENEIESTPQTPIAILFKETETPFKTFFYKNPKEIKTDFTLKFKIKPTHFISDKNTDDFITLKTTMTVLGIFFRKRNILSLQTKNYNESYTLLDINTTTKVKFVMIGNSLETYINGELRKSNSNFEENQGTKDGFSISSKFIFSPQNFKFSDIEISEGNYTFQSAKNVVCQTCPPATIPTDDRLACVKCAGESEISENEKCVQCDPFNQIALQNKCVRCADDQAVISNTCVDCGIGRIRSKMNGLCMNICPGNAILEEDGLCTPCPNFTFSTGAKCESSCPQLIKGNNIMSSEGCVSKCTSGLQFPAGTCYEPRSNMNTCPSAASINLKGVCTNTCPKYMFISYDFGTGVNNGKGNICTKTCPFKSTDALGKQICQWNYCPSATPYLQYYGTYGLKECRKYCESNRLDGASQTCVDKCSPNQTWRNVSSTYVNVCKSNDCGSDSLDKCSLTTNISDKLPTMFGVKPVRFSIAYTFSAANASCDSNILFDSIATFINDPRISSASCGAFDGSLGCAETMLRQCLLSTNELTSVKCLDFLKSANKFGYSKLSSTLELLKSKTELLKGYKDTVLTMNAVKIVMNTVQNLLSQNTKASGIDMFANPAEFYLVWAVLSRFIQNYDIEKNDFLLVRRIVEWAHLSFFSMDDIANMYLSHTYSSATTYLFDITSSSTIQFKRNLRGSAANDTEDFDKRMFTSSYELANLVSKTTSGCSINKLPDSAMGCLSVGMYLSKSVDKPAAIIAFDAIFAGSIMAKIYENCAGWAGNDWDGITGRDAPYNQRNCNDAIANFCNLQPNKYQDPLCVMANVIVSPFFSELAPQKCPNGYPCMPKKYEDGSYIYN